MPYFPLQNTPILILFFLTLLSLCSADDYLAHICPNTTTFTPNSTFQNNRDQLLSSLISNVTSDTGFYQTSAGGTDTVEGLFLCRGDVPPDACQDCVYNVASEVIQRCPIQKQVLIWYDECMVRYSNQSFLSTAWKEFSLYRWNDASGALVPQFNQTLEQTMNGLFQKVINAALKYATQEANITQLITLYTAGQCMRDLSTKDCMNCLTVARAQLPADCCYIRFEVFAFYKLQVIYKADSPPPSPASIANPRPTTGKSKLLFIVIPSILAPVAFCVLVVVVARCFVHKSKRAKQQQNKAEVDMTTVESLQFHLGTIEAATKKFSGDNKLGEGGFGQVFKAAWQLWNEGEVLELMDPLLKDSCSPNEFLRYIHIGLLCVQEDANKRPTMSSVVLMLKSESISLAKPDRPAFFTGRCINDQGHTLGDLPGCSVNGLTVSDDIPR